MDCGDNAELAIGLTKADSDTRTGCMPGWPSDFSGQKIFSTLGIGYHGDDGGIYHYTGRPIERGEAYTTGDVVGCYLWIFERSWLHWIDMK